MIERGTHRIRSGDGESVLRDGLTFEEARAEHHRLSEAHLPHFWDTYSGPRAGWCSIAGLFEASDAPKDLPKDTMFEVQA